MQRPVRRTDDPEIGERLGVGAPAEIGAVGDFRARLAGVFAGDDETLLIDERERAEDHRVSDREQRGVRADAEAEDQNNDAREGRCPPQRPRRESQPPRAAHCSRRAGAEIKRS